jgi:glycosyltransferase involved in cell wall biosynthesis
MQVSVVICTHNPLPNALRRALGALKEQTLAKEQWELLLVDNHSTELLASSWDLSWHPNARHIREDEVGLTPARLRGIKEGSGELLTFVDDDNVLAPDYLSQAVSIFHGWPMLGAIGASIEADFEIPPPDWVIPYLPGLAIHKLDQDYWSNSNGWSNATPYGAGLCVRRSVAEDYSVKVTDSRVRRTLDRTGRGMGAGGDLDLAWCSIDLGMGTGRFSSLRLTHLIPRIRLTEDYIVRLNVGFAAANETLNSIRANDRLLQQSSWKAGVRFLIDFLRANRIQRRIMLGSARARRDARLGLAQKSICGDLLSA